MKSSIVQNLSLALSLSFVVLLVFNSCKKNETGPQGTSFDPAFVGVWYSDSIATGFEVLADGSSKTLIVDSAGTLQYAIPGTGATSEISLSLLGAKDGNLTANVRYYVPGFFDTTVTIPGTYVFSNNNNTVSITFPNPQSPGQVETIIFRRSSIGAIVRAKSRSESVESDP